ncbi:bZIP transcription factor [Achlya hypogyna]|uniref:BZIP transcription factor n=1 Tax=Achlya hypogyna TaxID=1202772 RepID=A0A1V9Y9J6_ACHHY|nr:bZIP transcription factor [Achlya hypogyna]
MQSERADDDPTTAEAAMSTIKTHPPTLPAKKPAEPIIRVKEEFPKMTLPMLPSPGKLKIPAPVVRKDKRKAMVHSPIGSDCSSSSSSSSSKKRKNTSDGMFDNDMGSAEEKIKEMERQLLSLDPDSKEAKKKRRLIRNRMSAQLHRERKKAYVVQLEEQLQAKDDEMAKMKAQLEALLAENKRLKQDDVIKVEKVEEPVVVAPKITVATAFVESASAAQADIISDAESFIYELDSEPEHWDSSILNDLDISSEDLMFSDPVVAPAPARPTKTVEHDSFAAKKNVAMMMAIVFSMTFFGGMMSIFDSFTTGNATNGFCSYFKSYTPKLLSEMSVKSRVLSDLDGTTWMDFPELDEPAQKSDKSGGDQQYAGGIPFDDLLDTDFSLTFAMPLGDEEEEEDEDMGRASESGDHTSEEEESDDSEAAFTVVSKDKDVSYANLTRLWCEKRHVLCTLATQGEPTLRRAVVDMSHVKDTVSMESSFADVLASFTMGDEDPKILGSSEKQVLSFLYPMGVFSKEMDATLDPMPFMEVACHI